MVRCLPAGRQAPTGATNHDSQELRSVSQFVARGCDFHEHLTVTHLLIIYDDLLKIIHFFTHIAFKTPFTNFPDSSVPNSFAISIASFMTTAGGASLEISNS